MSIKKAKKAKKAKKVWTITSPKGVVLTARSLDILIFNGDTMEFEGPHEIGIIDDAFVKDIKDQCEDGDELIEEAKEKKGKLFIYMKW